MTLALHGTTLTKENWTTPTVTFTAGILCRDGRRLTGQMFMPPVSRHCRRMRPEERLNEADLFVPFLAEGQHAVLLNKETLAVVSVSDEQYAPFVDAGYPDGGTARRIVVECAGDRVEGTVLIRRPGPSSRVLDFLNAEERFFVLTTATGHRIINKAAVTVVSESDEGTLRPPPMP